MKVLLVNDDGSVILEVAVPQIPQAVQARLPFGDRRKQAKAIAKDFLERTNDWVDICGPEIIAEFALHRLSQRTRSSAFAYWKNKGKAERGERGKYRWLRPRLAASS